MDVHERLVAAVRNSLLLKRHDSSTDRVVLDKFQIGEHEPFSGIRCPLCAWRPLLSSRWMCDCHGTPEPPFTSCGTQWNTFATRGWCPGCSHRWQWTSCLRCHQPSLHDDWYDDDEDDQTQRP